MRRSAVLSVALGALPALISAWVSAAPSGPFARATSSASASASAPASASGSAAPAADPGFAPDPQPLTTRKKWIYDVIYDQGAIFVPTPTPLEKPRPTETPRTMGRFFLEIYVGPTLLDRVHFDIPLLLGEWVGVKRGLDAPPDFERKLRARVRVEVPDSPRATFAQLVDRASGRKLRVPWPPTDTTAPVASASARLGFSACTCSSARRGKPDRSHRRSSR